MHLLVLNKSVDHSSHLGDLPGDGFAGFVAGSTPESKVVVPENCGSVVLAEAPFSMSSETSVESMVA